MADAASIKVVKTIPFKGDTQEWSNRYHFNNGAPTDGAHWTTFADLVVAAEKHIYRSDISIVRVFGYEGGSEVAVFTKSYTTVGDLGAADSFPQASETVALGRWGTNKRSTKNHPVYLFNYWHGVYTKTPGEIDELLTLQKTAMETYGAAWVAGFNDGASVKHRAGPDETLALGMVAERYVTHRDFR